MAVGTALVTVEEYLRLQPPKAGHYELHHGEIVLMTAPKWGHQRIQDRLTALLRSMAGDRAYVTKEMSFRPAPEYEVWEADVGLALTERANSVADDEYLTGAPDLAVEVLSPSNTVDEIAEKMSVCMANGCISFWVVDPKRKRVSVTEGDVTKHYGLSASISCSLLGADVPVEEIFKN
ncbi:MAG TPA: Uma2 family endonuclease [Bryobacteraceae bacterium]|jgi:Uma2 family endonuclease|nr:Uma2 family endonuclease [Bryobacteraceae bacterium]